MSCGDEAVFIDKCLTLEVLVVFSVSVNKGLSVVRSGKTWPLDDRTASYACKRLLVPQPTELYHSWSEILCWIIPCF